MALTDECLLCRQQEADAEFDRVEVWSDDLWRLTISLDAEVSGFSYLEPKRHIPHIEDVDGPEGETLGTVIGHVSAALKEITAAERVYLYIFGGRIPHLHIFLVPVRPGDPVIARIIEGEVDKERRVGGAVRWGSTVAAKVPRDDLQSVAEQLRKTLSRS